MIDHVYTSPEAEAAINRLPHDLVQMVESFHMRCFLHLAKASEERGDGWKEKDIDTYPRLKGLLDKAVADADWTSVANYAAIMNSHGFTAPSVANETDNLETQNV